MGHLGNLKWDDLSDYMRRGSNIAAMCGHCQRFSVLNSQMLYRYFIAKCWRTDMRAVALRLYCIRCKRRPSKLSPSGAPVNAPRFLPETEDQWRRLIRRLRG